MNRKLIQFVTSLLTNTGINILNSDDIYLVWRFIISFGVVSLANILCCMVTITHTDNFYDFITPIPYIAGITIQQTGIYFIFHHRQIISEMIHEMDQYFYTYPDEDSFGIEYVWYLQEENITTLMTITKLISFSVFFIMSAPIFAELLYFGRIKTILFPMWTPWKMDNLMAELSVFLIEAVEGFFGLWIHFVTMVFLVAVAIEFQRQYRRLTSAVKSLEIRSSAQSSEQKCFDRALRENIINCIRHHQILHK